MEGRPFKECSDFAVECGRKGGLKSRSFKLTKSQVKQAIEMRAKGMYWRDIAEHFNCSASGIHKAVNSTERNYPETIH